jgi:hypothetical protein
MTWTRVTHQYSMAVNAVGTSASSGDLGEDCAIVSLNSSNFSVYRIPT